MRMAGLSEKRRWSPPVAKASISTSLFCGSASDGRGPEPAICLAGQSTMTDQEVEVVAEELAKLVHVPWAPGYETSPLIHVVTECHRAEARAILAALDQIRPGRSGSSFQAPRSNEPQGISCQSRSGDVRPDDGDLPSSRRAARLPVPDRGNPREPCLLGSYSPDLRRMDVHRTTSGRSRGRGLGYLSPWNNAC
jgi:hypothetical protein